MASKFVVAVALFAVCHSSPVDELRGARSYTGAIGSSIGYGHRNSAHAVVAGNKADAQAVNENSEGVARDSLGNSLPSQAYAKVGTFDTPGDAAGFGYAQPAYYSLPAPATVVAYQKYANAPVEIPSQIVYEAQPSPSLAKSSAVINGYGAIKSAANTGYGTASSNADAQGSGPSAVSSIAQTEPVGVEPVVIAAKTQGLHSVYTPAYTPNSASSSANVNGNHGSAVSAARTGVPARKSISWRFGTAYDQPAAYGAAKSAAANYGQGSAAAKSDVSPVGALSSSANTHGSGSAQSAASNNAYGSAVRSATGSFGAGYSNANANVNNANYAVLRSENIQPAFGRIGSSATSHNGGSAISKASTDVAGNEYVDSAAKSAIGGSAQSASYNNGGAYGFRSTGSWGGRLASDSSSSGVGSAASNAQGLSTGYKVVNSAAYSDPSGSARANAYGA